MTTIAHSSSYSTSTVSTSRTMHSLPSSCDLSAANSPGIARREAFQEKLIHRFHHKASNTTHSAASCVPNLKHPKPKRLTITKNVSKPSTFRTNNLFSSKRPCSSAFVPFSKQPQTIATNVSSDTHLISNKQRTSSSSVSVITYDTCIELIETLSIPCDQEDCSEDREVKEHNKSEIRRRHRNMEAAEDDALTLASSSAFSASTTSTALYWMLSSASNKTPPRHCNNREGANLSFDRWFTSAKNMNNNYYCVQGGKE